MMLFGRVIITILACIFFVPTIVFTGLSVVPTVKIERSLYYYQDENIQMKDYLLIGTHGSVAYNINTRVLVHDRGITSKRYFGYILPGITKRWSKNQHYDILSQLRMGVRFLHIEVGWYNKKNVAIHSFYCMDLVEVLNQVHIFLDQTTKGFVFLQLQKFGTFPDDHNFTNIMKSHHTYNKTINKFTLLKDIYKSMVILKTFYQRPSLNRQHWNLFLQTAKQEINRTSKTNLLTSGFSWVMTPNQNTILTSINRPFDREGLYTFPTVKNKLSLQIFVNQFKQELKGNYLCILIDHFDFEDINIIENINQNKELREEKKNIPIYIQ